MVQQKNGFDDPISPKKINARERDTREQLIKAGIQELQENGIEDFSIRRVAAACGISCAAPYRHFKNKEDFVSSIFSFILRKWYLQQNVILSEYEGTRERIVEMSVAYVRFLADNPELFRVLIHKNDGTHALTKNDRPGGLSSCMLGLIEAYCRENGITKLERDRRICIIRSLVYGAVMMILCGELENSEESFDVLKCAIARETDA